MPRGPYLVVGLQRAGLAAGHALADAAGAHAVAGWDAASTPHTERARTELAERGVRVELGGDGTALLDAAPRPRCVIKSPGVPPGAPALRAALTRGIPVIDELELGWRMCAAPVVGVTGTNGKSTTAALIQAALKSAGIEAPLAGNTLFGPPLSALEAGPEAVVVCEVSSFQLEGCPSFVPEAGVLTTLSPEHLDRHGTLELYGACKAAMFARRERRVRRAALNTGVPIGRRIAADLAEGGSRVASFGERGDAGYRVAHARTTIGGSALTLRTPTGEIELETRLPGRHNAVNTLAALALCETIGLERDGVIAAIAAAPGVPGRFERIESPQPFDVVVDFAHNDAGVRAAIATAREVLAERESGSLRAVVSVGSFFDSAQREEIGRVAREGTDQLILSADRRPGDPPGIPVELLSAARSASGAQLVLVEDRREAISTAIAGARAGDIILILGRGALTGPMVAPGGGESRFDDREVARSLVAATPAPA